MRDDFFSRYFEYAKGTETPMIFHRWSAIVGLGAFLGRRFQYQHGHQILNPNIYVLLIGLAGTKKSTSIKMFKKILTQAGYETFAAEKTTKEKFLIDLAGEESDESIMEKNIFGDLGNGETAECFIAADEFNDFFGNNSLEFISMLGSLWDFNGVYKNRVKNSKSIIIQDPTISILGGNTPTGFNSMFPPEILGQGFFSRLLLIYGEPTGVKITFPRIPSESELVALIEYLSLIKKEVHGFMEISSGAMNLLDSIYRSWKGIDDIRFDSYSNRRFTHLLKLCIVHTAARCSRILEEEDVIYTNTVLTFAEHYMPKALGEFGKARNSDVVHKILQYLDSSELPVTIKDIWKHVSNDLERQTDLATVLGNLAQAEKIIAVKQGFLIKRKVLVSSEATKDIVDFSLLTEEERRML